jgi:mannosyl-oligosaccharide alpha-1,2-mannosidase
MNVRDPFNLHRSSAYDILRGTARQAAANVTQRVREAGAQAIEAGSQAYETGKQTFEDMSFSIPKNVPSFTDAQRQMENQVWGASGMTARSHTNGGVMSGMQDRMGNFFEKNTDLPMYKDKPYVYVSSRRRRSAWKRKRVLGLGVTFVMLVLYFLGFFGSDAAAKKQAKETWTWLQRPEKTESDVNWDGRRERVVEAFKLSWDAYDRYAWGMELYSRFIAAC